MTENRPGSRSTVLLHNKRAKTKKPGSPGPFALTLNPLKHSVQFMFILSQDNKKHKGRASFCVIFFCSLAAALRLQPDSAGAQPGKNIDKTPDAGLALLPGVHTTQAACRQSGQIRIKTGVLRFFNSPL